MREETTVRHSEPEDYEAIYRVYSGSCAMANTLGLPFSSKRPWRERLAPKREGEFSLVACAGDEVVGHLSLYLYPEPRMRHSGHFGMAVRDDWQGKRVGTKLLEAAVDLADNWLGLTRLDCRVFADNGAAIALYRRFGFKIEEPTNGSPSEEASTQTRTSWLDLSSPTLESRCHSPLGTTSFQNPRKAPRSEG